MNVGFTTGALYRLKFPFGERVSFYRSLGATAIELSFPFTSELLSFELSSKMAEDIKEFSYVSIHAPFKEVKYDSGSCTGSILEKLRALCKSLPVKGIVLHPDLVSDFSLLEEAGLPFLLENMDPGKQFGTIPKHFEKLRKACKFGFVLDTQHGYENDHSMKLCKQLISVMGNRLKHMHVSGFSGQENHVPVHIAENRGKIVEILELGLKVPKILEGRLLTNVSQTASRELDFVKSFEK